MDKKCSKCTTPTSRKNTQKLKRNTDLGKSHKQACCHKPGSKSSSTDKLSASCNKSRSHVRLGADSQKLDAKTSKNDINIDVNSIYAETSTSGAINIPLKLMVCVKRSKKDVDSGSRTKCSAMVKPPENMVFNSCTDRNYCDPYIHEMADLNDQYYSLHAFIIISTVTTKATTIAIPATAVTAATSKNEIADTSGTNSYVEQYTLIGYTTRSQENIGIQTDLILGAQLQSKSLESIKEPPPSRTKSTDTCTCATATQTGSKDPDLPWTGLLLPEEDTCIIECVDKAKLDDTVEDTLIIPYIKPPPKKKKGFSSCSRCCDVDIPEPPPPPPDPPEILFVYNRCCGKTEPYIYQLVRYSAFPYVEPKGMSWGTLAMSNKILIRVMTKCVCNPKPMPAPMPKLLELKCTHCKMKLHKSAPTSRVQMLSPKMSPSKCDPCSPKCTKSEGSNITPTKQYVNFKEAAPKMEVLYKNKNDTFSNTKVVKTSSPPCNKPISTGYDPHQCEDPNAYYVKPDPVDTALKAFEAELKPMKTTLNLLQQKLKNLNMPELDFMFNKPQVVIRPKLTKVAKINLADSIKLLYGPHKKPLKSQRFGRVSSKRRCSHSKSKLSKSKSRSRSRSRSCSRCSSTASCNSKTSKKGKSHKSSKHKKGKSHKKSSKYKGGSRTPSLRSSGSNRSVDRHTSSCKTCKGTKEIVIRPNTKSIASSSCFCSSHPSTSASKARPRSKSRVKSFRIRSKHYTKCVSRTSSEESNSGECPFLEAIKSILVDRQKITKQHCGTSQTQNIENIRMHVRLQPRKKKH